MQTRSFQRQTGPVMTVFVLALSCLAPQSIVGAQEPQESPQPLTIAIVRDRDSVHFDAVIAGFTAELEDLARGQYRFVVQDAGNAAGDLSAVETLIQDALADPGVDVIFAAGVVSTSVSARMDPRLRIKPIVGGAIEFADLDDSLLAGSGASALSNYTFVRSPRRIPADLERLARITGAKSIHALIDSNVIDFFGQELQSRVEQLEKRLGLRLTLIGTAASVERTMESLPDDAEAVYVSLLNTATKEDRRKLFAALAERRLPTLSIRGVVDVQLGALAGLAPDNASAVHRRIALNLHQILNGIPTELLPVTLRAEDRLVVNMETARRIGWSPDYDTSLAATFLNRDGVRADAKPLSLEHALEIASQESTEVRSALASRDGERSRVDALKSSYRPQIGVNGQAAYSRIHDRINRRTTPRHSEQASLGAELTQLLYSNRIHSEVSAQMLNSDAADELLRSVRLDAMETAGLAFLDSLSTEALYDIEKENLLLIENNLQIAKLRRDIGQAEASEVFRWESSQAEARAQLILRDRDRLNARVRLNVALGAPRTMDWRLTDIELAEDDFYFVDDDIAASVTSQQEFQDFLEFIKSEAAAQSPEVRSFERSVAAQDLLLEERRTRNYLPEVSLTAGYDHVLQDGQRQSTDSQNEWSLGIGFSVPLFDGGLRRAEMHSIQASIRELSARRDAALYLIEQRALAAGYGISATHPGMRLSRRALRAAERSFQAVQSKYSQGAASIVDVLDAQRDLLSRRQSAAVAVYAYLQDIISLQRAIAWFEYSKSPEEKAAWAGRLKEFLAAKVASRKEER